MHPDYLNDDGNPIRVDVQPAWSLFKTAGVKQFKMVKVYTISDVLLQPKIDVKVDYDLTPPTNEPDVSLTEEGAAWDEADWDEDYWALGAQPVTLWNGCAGLGQVGAPRLTALILNSKFSITGFDVIYEPGAVL
jgi:hypothetical protein